MKLHCPHCGVKGSAEDSYSGRTVKCPKCLGMFEVKPEMASQLHDDPSLSALSAPPTESPAPLDEVETPSTDERGVEATEGDEILPATELEELAEAGGERADAAIENPPLAEEEELNWEDIASEIDLHSAEHDLEEDLEGDPAGLSSLQDDFEKPAGDFGSTTEDEDTDSDDIEEEFGEDIWAEAGDEPAEKIEATEPAEEAPFPDPADSVTAEQEIADELIETFENDEEQLVDDEIEELEEVEDVDGIEIEPYGIDKEQCWQCGKENSEGEEPFIAKDDRLYCAECLLIEQMKEVDAPPHQELDKDLDAPGLDDDGLAASAVAGSSAAFSIGDTLRQAWAKIKGAKGSIWAGSAIMYLVLLVLVVGGALLLPSANSDAVDMSSLLISSLLQVLTNVFSVIFGAGLLYMGIRKAAGDPISWTMIFRGFSCAGKIIVATILQSIFIALGFLLLVLPGIYLLVGYAMTIPLIIDKGMKPWQAMEMSRKAIHKVWWKVTGLFIVMGIIFGVTAFPPLLGVSLALPIFFTMSWQMLLGLGAFALLGIGLIWTWPMFLLLGGVIYGYLFGGEKEVS